VQDDFVTMGRRATLAPRGFIELQRMVKHYDIDDISLQKVYALVFQKKISKAQQLTNWEAPTLTEQQKQYAALDAWACLNIYNELCSREQAFI
jgi:ribonuclease D